MPSVSVIIPCYNAQATIAETVESALSQPPVSQVIVVDDGSTDGSPEILRSFGDKIQPVFGPNRGVSAARNQGIGLAAGDWIQFLDSDDLLVEGTLEKRLEDAGADADMVICDWREFLDDHGRLTDGDERKIDARAVAVDAEIALAGQVWAPPAAVLYKRNLVERIGGFRLDLPVIQDARFLFDAARLGARIVYSPHTGARYRVLTGSLSRRRPEAMWNDVLSNGHDMEALWLSEGPLDIARIGVLSGVYDLAARELMACGGSRYFEAAAAAARLGPVSRHNRLGAPLARLVGLKRAHSLLSLVKTR